MDILYVDTSYKYSNQDKEIIKHCISNNIYIYLPHDYYILLENPILDFYFISNIYLDISMWVGIKNDKFLQIVYPYLPNSFSELSKESIGYGMYKNCSLELIWLEFIFNISDKFKNIRNFDSYNYFIGKYSNNNIEILGGFKEVEYKEQYKSYVLRKGHVNKDICIEWGIYQCNKRYIKSDIPIKDCYILSKEGGCINIGLIKEVFLNRDKLNNLVGMAELLINST